MTIADGLNLAIGFWIGTFVSAMAMITIAAILGWIVKTLGGGQ